MKLNIEKLPPSGNVRIGFTADSSKKPIAIELDKNRIEMLIQMLRLAADMDEFRFALQL